MRLLATDIYMDHGCNALKMCDVQMVDHASMRFYPPNFAAWEYRHGYVPHFAVRTPFPVESETFFGIY